MHHFKYHKNMWLVAGAVLGVCAPVCAEEGARMVTYFPVPYAVYNTVSAKKMDVGVLTDYNVTLGASNCPEETAEPPLKADTLTFSNKLTIAHDVYTPTVKVGKVDDPNSKAAFAVNFEGSSSKLKLFLNNTNSFNVVPTVQAGTGELTEGISAFPAAFSNNVETAKQFSTVCSGKALSWNNVKLGNDSANHYYLVCGSPDQLCSEDTSSISACTGAVGTWHYGESSAQCYCSCSTGYKHPDDGSNTKVCKENCFNNAHRTANKSTCCSKTDFSEDYAICYTKTWRSQPPGSDYFSDYECALEADGTTYTCDCERLGSFASGPHHTRTYSTTDLVTQGQSCSDKGDITEWFYVSSSSPSRCVLRRFQCTKTKNGWS